MAMDREELFERTPVFKAIYKLTLPMIFGSIVSILYNLADTFFVGQLNDPVQNAAVTFVAPAMTLFYAVTNMFGIGASSVMSRALGVKDHERVKRASATGIYCGLICAVLMAAGAIVFNTPLLKILGTTEGAFETTKAYMFWTVCLGAVPCILNIMFGYLLRAEGKALVSSIGMMSGCLINIVLDPFFILPFGLNLGAEGAAAATFLSNCMACLFFGIYLYFNHEKTLVCVNPKYITFRKDVIGEIFTVGIPGVFQNNLNVLSMTLMNNLMSAYSDNAVAAMGIASKINQLPIQIIFGFSQGIMPLIGYNYASRDYRRMKESIRKTMGISISALFVLTLLFVFGGSFITSMFMKDAEIVRVGGLFLRGFGISLMFMAVDFMAVGVSQAFGIGKYALMFSFLRKAFLEIPFMLLYNTFIGLEGIVYAQCSAEIVMSIFGFFVLKKLIKDAEARK